MVPICEMYSPGSTEPAHRANSAQNQGTDSRGGNTSGVAITSTLIPTSIILQSACCVHVQ